MKDKCRQCAEPPSSTATEAQGAKGEWDYRFEQEVRRELLRQGIEFDATLEQIVNATRRVLAAHPPAVPRCPKCGSSELKLEPRVVIDTDKKVTKNFWLVKCPGPHSYFLIEKFSELAQFFFRQDSPQASAAHECAARKAGTAGGNSPQDCNWPFCGCDPKANKVLEAVQESGYPRDVGGAISTDGHNPNIPICCNSCGKPLLMENLFVDDGCPCNSPRGVNLKPQPCELCKIDCCVKPGHRLSELFGVQVAKR